MGCLSDERYTRLIHDDSMQNETNEVKNMHQRIYVWDKFIRLFHWSLVALFVTSYLTGENEHWTHFYSGYAIVTLIALRLIWGVIGSKYARFSEFVRSPSAVFRYMKSMATGNPKRYLGHNPAGGAMILMLLASLLVTTISGMKLLAIEEGQGPFASTINVSIVQKAYADDDDHEHEYEKYQLDEYKEDHEYENDTYKEQLKEYEANSEARASSDYEARKKEVTSEDDHEAEEEFWEEIHEASISFMLFLIILHVMGVIIASRQHKESLVKSMLSGYKNQ